MFTVRGGWGSQCKKIGRERNNAHKTLPSILGSIFIVERRVMSVDSCQMINKITHITGGSGEHLWQSGEELSLLQNISSLGLFEKEDVCKQSANIDQFWIAITNHFEKSFRRILCRKTARVRQLLAVVKATLADCVRNPKKKTFVYPTNTWVSEWGKRQTFTLRHCESKHFPPMI